MHQVRVFRGGPSDFVTHLKSNSSLPRSANTFSTYWEDKFPMPLHFYSGRRILKAARLFPIAEANPRALEALKNPREAVLEPQARGTDRPPVHEGNSSSLSLPPPKNSRQSPPPPVPAASQKNVSGQCYTTVVLGPEDQGGVGLATPQTPSFTVIRFPESHPLDPSACPPGGFLPPPRPGKGLGPPG
ncbi:hypothetical protein LIER_14623 [Lithospermum erythrorhizon]|uniref:Uncharacterized protein n=1 Tax=Lithospermum erythrorhizon TaxID=34254 RepID=A0AAV3Q1F1_LITER